MSAAEHPHACMCCCRRHLDPMISARPPAQAPNGTYERNNSDYQAFKARADTFETVRRARRLMRMLQRRAVPPALPCRRPATHTLFACTRAAPDAPAQLLYPSTVPLRLTNDTQSIDCPAYTAALRAATKGARGTHSNQALPPACRPPASRCRPHARLLLHAVFGGSGAGSGDEETCALLPTPCPTPAHPLRCRRPPGVCPNQLRRLAPHRPVSLSEFVPRAGPRQAAAL